MPEHVDYVLQNFMWAKICDTHRTIGVNIFENIHGTPNTTSSFNLLNKSKNNLELELGNYLIPLRKLLPEKKPITLKTL
jgi:hypothetical protein